MDLWDCKNISNGTNIDILRSDGRVHSAVVRSVNRNCSTVTVEWFEKGEAKGKEVDLEAVFHLNPNVNVSNIKRQDTSMSRPVLLAAQASNNKPHMSTARSSLELELLSQSLDDGSSSSSKSAGIAKDAGFVDNPDFSNVSFSLVNSSFGWIRGNGHKNPMRYSSSVKDTDRSNSKREDHCKARSSRSPKTTLEIESLTPKQEFISMINDYRNLNVSVSLKGNYQLGDCHQICVCVRKRPLNFKELKSKEVDVITIPNVNQIVIHEPKLKVDLTKYLDNQNFRFDLVFDETVDNFLVYQYTAMPLVECIFNRGMATCFAYGQTGSGKTHTMGGEFLARGSRIAPVAYTHSLVIDFAYVSSSLKGIPTFNLGNH